MGGKRIVSIVTIQSAGSVLKGHLISGRTSHVRPIIPPAAVIGIVFEIYPLSGCNLDVLVAGVFFRRFKVHAELHLGCSEISPVARRCQEICHGNRLHGSRVITSATCPAPLVVVIIAVIMIITCHRLYKVPENVPVYVPSLTHIAVRHRRVRIYGSATHGPVKLQGIGTLGVGVAGGRIIIIGGVHAILGDGNRLLVLSRRKGKHAGLVFKVGAAHSGAVDGAVVYHLLPFSAGQCHGKGIVSVIGNRKASQISRAAKWYRSAVDHAAAGSFGIGSRKIGNASRQIVRSNGNRPVLFRHRLHRLRLAVIQRKGGASHNAPYKACLCDRLAARFQKLR